MDPNEYASGEEEEVLDEGVFWTSIDCGEEKIVESDDAGDNRNRSEPMGEEVMTGGSIGDVS